MLGMCTSVRENFSETKFFEIIQVDDVINRANIFSIGSPGFLWQGVKLCYFQCEPWVAITTVVLPYNCDTNNARFQDGELTLIPVSANLLHR